MRRLLVPLLATGALLILAAPPASAAKPVIARPASFEVTIPFPDVCPDFEMDATVTGRQLVITFVDSNGTPTAGFLGGQLFVTWTRRDTGFSRTFTIAGPSFQDASGTAVHGVGPWTTPLEGTGWVYVKGNLTFNGTQDGFALIESYNGTATTICDLMA